MNEGGVIMAAIAKAGAIEYAMRRKDSGGWIFIWKANADEQIEAALRDLGYELKSIQLT